MTRLSEQPSLYYDYKLGKIVYGKSKHKKHSRMIKINKSILP